VGAVGLRGAVAILIAGTGVGLAVGSANADAAAVAVAELEAPYTADSGDQDATPTAQKAEQRRERRELQFQQQEERFAHVRVVLFSGIELSAEQSRGVDAIIETQLKDRRRSGELRAELDTAQQQGDTERIRAIRAERRPLRERRKGPDESMEEMRVLLSEEQHPIFDMNRARLAAEDQQPKKGQRQRRPRAGAEVEAE
jgi:hypothetical protein